MSTAEKTKDERMRLQIQDLKIVFGCISRNID